MAVVWTLETEDESRTLAAWGVNRVKRTRRSMQADLLTFTAAHGDVSAPPFAYGETVRLRRDGVQWFVGRVNDLNIGIAGPREEINYTIVGPWWHLDELVFADPWFAYLDGSGAKQQVYSTHVVLINQDTGSLMSVAEIVQAAVDYASDQGAPIQVGTLDLPITPPIDEVRDTTCGELLRKVMRWHPDAVAYFDYSTDIPTLNVKRRANLTAAPNLTKGPGLGQAAELRYFPRFDAQRPAVAIKYQRVRSVNGREIPEFFSDIAPAGATGRELRALSYTVNLIGAKLSQVSAEIETAPISINSVAWWQNLFPELAEARVVSCQFAAESGKTPRRTNMLVNAPARYLVDGAIADWMEISADEEEFEAWFDVEMRSSEWPSGKLERKRTLHKHIRLVTTDAASGVITSGVTGTLGEPVPLGIAAIQYEALRELQYDGGFRIAEQDCTGKVGMGMKVTVIGHLLDSLVQEVVDEIDTGHTIVRVSPGQTLGVHDLVELLR